MSLTASDSHTFTRPQLLSERVYEQLKALILTNALHPGEALGEERIAGQWGISRTPLRAALTRLEREGLVQTVPHKGCMVSVMHARDVREVFEVRETLEVSAVRMATPHIPDARLTETARQFAVIAMELAADRYDLYIPSDAHFHALILEYVPNRLLLDMLGRIYDQVTRIRNFSHASPGARMREAFHEHERILAAIQRRDAAAAAEAMHAHLRNVTERAITLLDAPEGGERRTP